MANNDHVYTGTSSTAFVFLNAIRSSKIIRFIAFNILIAIIICLIISVSIIFASGDPLEQNEGKFDGLKLIKSMPTPSKFDELR